MKKNYITEAINLKNYPLGDNDSIVIMFSKTRGLLRAVAKGAKRPKSKLGARIQMFIANKLLLNEGKNLDTIVEAQSVNTFSKIRYDLDKLSYSMYIAELVNNFCSKTSVDTEHAKIYDLIYWAYNSLQTADSNKEVFYTVLKFQIHLMKILGWALDFDYCSMCQRKLHDTDKFSYKTGFVCCECSKKVIYDIKINNKIRLFLAELSNTSYDKETKYDSLVTEGILEKCFLFMKKYIDNIINKKTKIFEVLEKTAL